MLLFDGLCFFDTSHVHQTAFLHDEVVERPSSIDPICFLEFFRVCQSVEKQEELGIALRLVGCTRDALHLVFVFAELLLGIQGLARIEGAAHIHDGGMVHGLLTVFSWRSAGGVTSIVHSIGTVLHAATQIFNIDRDSRAIPMHTHHRIVHLLFSACFCQIFYRVCSWEVSPFCRYDS